MSNQDLQRTKSFHRLVFITRDDLLAARWWHEGMEATHAVSPDRRTALKVLLGLGGIVGAGIVLRRGCEILSEPSITLDALELQRKEGWAVGAPGTSLAIPHLSITDSADKTDWSSTLSALAGDLAPKDSRLDPYYVPTLFEVLNNPRGAGLASVLRPMKSPSMEVAHDAAQGLAGVFADENDRKNAALILDMPGPESVAAAAGLSPTFAPVFLFDNWPHPLGVVPSHHTLAAAVYHRPELLAARAQRPASAPPAFVLDSNRLSPYRDESDRFDNRYLARMPTADNFESLGIKRVLYVTATAQAHELDDLNDDFVAFRKKGIDVKMIALSDFAPASAELLARNRLDQPVHYHHYYYGGHPMGHLFFLSSYHWSSPSTSGRTWQGSLPRQVSGGGSFAPVSRPTLFSSRTIGGLSGVGKQKPSGFGRVSYRSGSSGGFGRSGSFGRSSFGSSG